MNKIKLMEVCGTHTMAIARAGIKKLLPKTVELVSGPGCPVCVTSEGDIERAMEIARTKDVIMTTFGDMMRVPSGYGSLESMKREGCDIRVVYSCLDALNVARKNPGKKVVFMGIGFETTSPTVAATIIEAKVKKIKNFFVLANFKLIFPALEAICRSKKLAIDGFICPGHVSVITGAAPYEAVAKRYRKPCVITGFDTIDILKGIERLVDKIKSSEYDVEIEYKRAVRREGNPAARTVMKAVFKPGDAEWRGIGVIKKSGLVLRKKYEEFDANARGRFSSTGTGLIIGRSVGKRPVPVRARDRGCLCGEVIMGAKGPRDCKLFRKACTPRSPVGPCMVSSEGTCAACYKYGE